MQPIVQVSTYYHSVTWISHLFSLCVAQEEDSLVQEHGGGGVSSTSFTVTMDMQPLYMITPRQVWLKFFWVDNNTSDIRQLHILSFSPNLLPRYLRMLMVPAIIVPSTSKTGTRPKGISAISKIQPRYNHTILQMVEYLLALYSFFHWSSSNLISSYFTSACAKIIRLTSAFPRMLK